jgi:hypothetical protein
MRYKHGVECRRLDRRIFVPALLPGGHEFDQWERVTR